MVFREDIDNFIEEQISSWPLAYTNYSGLANIRTKCLKMSGGAEIKVQFNPERMRSSAAKVDCKSIEERLCFLCDKNRPKQQKEINFANNFSILLNPYPIFQKHLTIALKRHANQEIKAYFPTMLSLAKAMPDYTIFYNGPQCGASAPDHMHFQAGNKGLMPIEDDFEKKQFAHFETLIDGVNIYNWKNYNRGLISLEASSYDNLIKVFDVIFSVLSERQLGLSEPMLNILSYHQDEATVVHIFPRLLHRPSSFFKEGEEQVLISPASVDMGGVFIAPREEDFNKINASHIESILSEVCLSEQECKKIINDVKELSIA